MNKAFGYIRHTTLLFVILAGGISAVLFSVKYQVHELEDNHTRLLKELDEERRALHVLHAEWATLNDPRRLETLASEHLGLEPVPPRQVVHPDAVLNIPMREMTFGEEETAND
ncbi:hypothetical protein V5T82_10125 [Magnetovibrio sp. PR-2]|uniref:cell division protein FtsL n=1 Tax=Magnetovibrio sp. PR-2 TaxID=3120356 RepID=UPI002FCE22C7